MPWASSNRTSAKIIRGKGKSFNIDNMEQWTLAEQEGRDKRGDRAVLAAMWQEVHRLAAELAEAPPQPVEPTEREMRELRDGAFERTQSLREKIWQVSQPDCGLPLYGVAVARAFGALSAAEVPIVAVAMGLQSGDDWQFLASNAETGEEREPRKVSAKLLPPGLVEAVEVGWRARRAGKADLQAVVAVPRASGPVKGVRFWLNVTGVTGGLVERRLRLWCEPILGSGGPKADMTSPSRMHLLFFYHYYFIPHDGVRWVMGQFADLVEKIHFREVQERTSTATAQDQVRLDRGSEAGQGSEPEQDDSKLSCLPTEPRKPGPPGGSGDWPASGLGQGDNGGAPPAPESTVDPCDRQGDQWPFADRRGGEPARQPSREPSPGDGGSELGASD